MSEPERPYELTENQEYSRYYPWTGDPEPISPVEAPPADEPTYEQFYPTDPYPAMSDEDKAVYETYYPNINKKESN